MKTAYEVKMVAYKLRKHWLGIDYDVFFRNCNHFAEEFLRIVLGFSVFPPYVNRITVLEPIFRPFIEPIIAIARYTIPQANNSSPNKA